MMVMIELYVIMAGIQYATHQSLCVVIVQLSTVFGFGKFPSCYAKIRFRSLWHFA